MKVNLSEPSGQIVHSDMITGLVQINISNRIDYDEYIYITCGKEGSFREWSGDTFQPKGNA